MKMRYPIYNLLHHDIKACADHLLEMSQHQEPSLEENVHHIFSRLRELHQFASKVRPDEHYYPLSDLKSYIDNTMLSYEDETNRLQTIRLSEAISLLGAPAPEGITFHPTIIKSLTTRFLRHFREDVKPGRTLFRKLVEIKRL